MTLHPAEYRSKIRRQRSKEAIALAMENRWEEAVAINRSILDLFPEELEAHNRLGKAFFELGEYDEARAAFAKALQLSPSNVIARKNLDRLTLLRKDTQLPKKGPKLSLQHFLEESGKTGIAVLEHLAGKETLAKMTAGNTVTLRIVERKLQVESGDSEYLGQLPPRLALRLIRLIQGGNRYEAAVTRLGGNEVTVIIREVFQHPSQLRIISFPSQSDQYRQYPRGALLEFDLPEVEDEEMETAFNSEWEENGDSANFFPRAAFTPEPGAEADET